jgi:hypothetical protein
MEMVGDYLCESDPKPVGDLPTSGFKLLEFTFSGANQITLDANGKYYIYYWFNGGNTSNYTNMGADDTSPTHPGNYYEKHGGAYPGIDTIFYLYGTPLDVELIDSYPTSNYNYYCHTYGPGDSYVGQCIDMGSTSYKLGSTKFYLKRFGSPTGNCYSAVYAAEGTAPNMYRVGSRLAKSDERPVTDISNTVFQTIEFTFTGDNQIVLDANGKYEIEFYYDGGNSNNLIGTALDTSSPTHPGNEYDCYSGTNPGTDCIFSLYGTPVTLDVSTLDATAITAASAKLHGSVCPIQEDPGITQYGFDYTDEQGNWKWST